MPALLEPKLLYKACFSVGKPESTGPHTLCLFSPSPSRGELGSAWMETMKTEASSEGDLRAVNVLPSLGILLKKKWAPHIRLIGSVMHLNIELKHGPENVHFCREAFWINHHNSVGLLTYYGSWTMIDSLQTLNSIHRFRTCRWDPEALECWSLRLSYKEMNCRPLAEKFPVNTQPKVNVQMPEPQYCID